MDYLFSNMHLTVYENQLFIQIKLKCMNFISNVKLIRAEGKKKLVGIKHMCKN